MSYADDDAVLFAKIQTERLQKPVNLINESGSRYRLISINVKKTKLTVISSSRKTLLLRGCKTSD